jgi:hypothetical protein
MSLKYVIVLQTASLHTKLCMHPDPAQTVTLQAFVRYPDSKKYNRRRDSSAASAQHSDGPPIEGQRFSFHL